MRNLKWLFGIGVGSALIVPLAMVIYYLTFYISKTQFEHDFIYRQVIVNINLIFLYIIPFMISLLCLLKRKHIRKQY